MRKLKVTRYRQEPGHCATASCATVANYYNEDIDYEATKEIAKKKVSKNLDYGLDSGEIAKLLNHVGFNKVDIVSTNLHFLDYSWAKFKKPKLINKLKEMKSKYKGEYRGVCNSIYKWLSLEEFDNNLVIDYDFGKYIRKNLDEKKPLVLSFNWTMYFRYTKQGEKNLDPVKGDFEEHAVVAYGYNKSGVHICDSHHDLYKYRLKRFRDGLYHIPWEHLMTIMGWGDLYIPDNYEK